MKKISIIGNVTRDAIIRDAGGKKAIGFGVAVNEKYKDKNQIQVEKTTFFNCTIWRDENTSLAQYITKGTKVFVEGTPDIDTYERDGKTVASIKIRVRDIELLGSKNKSESPEASTASTHEEVNVASANEAADDLPF